MESPIPSPRRRFQFSLRTLMIGVTLLAVYCGPFVWLFQDRQRLIHERDEAKVQAEQNHSSFQEAVEQVKILRQRLLEAKRSKLLGDHDAVN
jgi:hypothetical protein